MLVFRGAEVYPGDGAPFHADVGIDGGRIAAIGDRVEGDVVDTAGLILCPGFVDLHAHSALEPFRDPVLTPKIIRSFTSPTVTGNGKALTASSHSISATFGSRFDFERSRICQCVDPRISLHASTVSRTSSILAATSTVGLA